MESGGGGGGGGGGASKLGHYYNEEKTACRGMCAEGGGHSLAQAVCRGASQELCP